MNVEYIMPVSETYLLKIPKEFINSQLEITLKKVVMEVPDVKFKELINRTAGIIKNSKLDATDWQSKVRDEWER